LADTLQTEHFEIDASVVFQLGESLITDAVQALMELVKNSYDADASYCKVTVSTSKIEDHLSPFDGAKGWIEVQDDGTGMTLGVIRSGWLTISNSGKSVLKRKAQATVKGRTPLGDKGLGRLGTQRLGKNLEMITRVGGSAVQQRVWFSWDEFIDQKVLSEVSIRREEQPATRPAGTTLIISSLRDAGVWEGAGASQLETRISQMVSPYRAVRDFVVHANVNGQDLAFLEISDRLRDFAQIRYGLEFDGAMLSIRGKARLRYVRPESAATPEDKALFKRLVEDDDGSQFFDFLTSRKRAVDFHLQRSAADGWFASFESKFDLNDLDKKALVEGHVANPGPFSGEVDFFSLSNESSVEQDIYSAQDYRRTIESLSGIKVYRDGFGIPVPSDWLNLGSQWTKARSYYTLRPQNTLGYIAISAKDNSQLQEKTDREGFTDNAHFRNFMALLSSFISYSEDVQQFLRRGYNDFRKAQERRAANVDEDETPESLSARMTATLGRASQLQYKVQETGRRLKAAVEDADHLLSALNGPLSAAPSAQEVSEIVAKLREDTSRAAAEALEAQKYLEEASKLAKSGEVLATEIEGLREQIRQVYEIISLGLTAEALSHEINNVITQLGERSKKASRMLRAAGTKDRKLFTYLEYVESAVASLRRQMLFLEPTLRYAREKRERIDLNEYSRELLEHYTLHFTSTPIHVSLVPQARPFPFVIEMNKGKLVQILDNLILNSEYWIKEGFRTGPARGTISLELRRPYIIVSDSEHGIDPSIESSLFEPFVTTKAKGKGRGLGLYVVQQLLKSEGCEIELTKARNHKGRLFTFQIDLSGVLVS
jgi:signal transduction histidine kinase